MLPGLITQFPVGNPLSTTLPAELQSIGLTAPINGLRGVGFTLIKIVSELE